MYPINISKKKLMEVAFMLTYSISTSDLKAEHFDKMKSPAEVKIKTKSYEDKLLTLMLKRALSK